VRNITNNLDANLDFISVKRLDEDDGEPVPEQGARSWDGRPRSMVRIDVRRAACRSADVRKTGEDGFPL